MVKTNAKARAMTPDILNQPKHEITAEENKAAEDQEIRMGVLQQTRCQPSEVAETIRKLRAEPLTPNNAMEIVKVVKSMPYMSRESIQLLEDARTAYSLAVDVYTSEAHSSDLETGSSARELNDGTVTEEDGSAAEEDGTVTEEDGSVTEEDGSVTEEDSYTEAPVITLQEISTTADGLLALLTKERAKNAKKLAKERAKNALLTKKCAKNSEKLAKERAENALLTKEGTKNAKERAFLHQEAQCQIAIGKLMEWLQYAETSLEQAAILSQAELSQSMNTGSRNAGKQALLKFCGPKFRVAGEHSHLTALLKSKDHLDLKDYLIPGASNKYMLKQCTKAYAKFVSKDIQIPDYLQGEDRQVEKICHKMQKKRKGGKEEADSTAKFLSHEVECTQPYFLTLLVLISRCCKMSPSPPNPHMFTPAKTQIKEHQIIAGTENRPRRIADACISKPGCDHLLTLDMLPKLFFELKSFFRQNISLDALHKQCEDQTLAHLAKFIFQGLCLFGIGAPTKAIGVMGTWAYISILKLELIMEEYTDANHRCIQLKLTESDKVPLVSKATLNYCIAQFQCKKGLRGRVEQLKALRDKLYEKDDGLDENGVLMGVRLLHDLMMSPRSKLFGPDYKTIFCSGENTIDDLLGSGSFGLVFSLKEDTNAVMKVSLTPNPVHIDNEETILRHLGRQEGPDTIINDELALPVLIQVKNDFAFELGGCRHELKALILRPKGQSIQSLARVEDIECRLGEISSQLEGALHFIHEKNVVHNDVTPKNVVVCVNGVQWKVYLVDYGCASECKDKIHGFVGTAGYAHPMIFEKYPDRVWKALSAFDFYSLGLTISALLNKGDTSWDMTPFPTTLNKNNRDDFLSVVNNRFINAKAKIDKSNCSTEDKEAWIRWITWDVSREHRRRAPAALFQEPGEAELSPIPPISKNLRRAAAKRKEMTTRDCKSTGTSPKKKRPRTDFKSPCSSLIDSAVEVEAESNNTKKYRPNEKRRRPNRSMKVKGRKIKK